MNRTRTAHSLDFGKRFSGSLSLCRRRATDCFFFRRSKFVCPLVRFFSLSCERAYVCLRTTGNTTSLFHIAEKHRFRITFELVRECVDPYRFRCARMHASERDCMCGVHTYAICLFVFSFVSVGGCVLCVVCGTLTNSCAIRDTSACVSARAQRSSAQSHTMHITHNSCTH